MNNRHHTLLVCVALLGAVLLGGGCAAYQITTPEAMVELPQSSLRGTYVYRATTTDPVVVAVRIERMGPREATPRGSLDFWSEAISRALRDLQGYALLETHDVRSADGRSGRQLRFGRDQDNHAYLYWVTIFVTEKRLHLIEAGGERAAFEAQRAHVEAAIESYEVRR